MSASPLNKWNKPPLKSRSAAEASPGEVAAAFVFLASDESSYITGVDLAVDGHMAQV